MTFKNSDNPIMKILYSASLTMLFLFITGCTGDKETGDKSVVLGRYDFSNGWVRPGSEGGNSAAYLRITNGTATDDTLIGLSSNTSESISLHETIENDGLTEMKALNNPVISSGSSMDLEPGGKHIMLMQLNSDLIENDSVKITLEFAQAGSREVTLPVQLQD